jgi:hypothetical protein
MSDPNETANLVGQLVQGYREHLAEKCGPSDRRRARPGPRR